MLKRTSLFCLVALVAAACPSPLSASAKQPGQSAQSKPQALSGSSPKKNGTAKTKRPIRLKELVVYGAAPEPDKSDLSSNRSANPASVTVAKYPAEVKRSTTTYGELLRPLTGVTVDDYGQGGLGYGISIRGFDQLEHGRDVATFVDGVPQNQTSSIQVNGYTDLNDLNPQLVNTTTLTRGPFDVRAGDFNIGGSVEYTTLDAPPSGITLTGGQYGTVRGNGIYSGRVGDIGGFLSLLVDDTQGYRHNDSLMRINTFDKVTFPLLNGLGAFRFQFFNDTFGAPSYINRALVALGQLSPATAVNSTDGGNRTEENVVFNYRQAGSDQPLSVNLYAIHNVFNRYATFSTDALPINPTQPGQALSADRRYILGGNGYKFWLFSLPRGMKADLLAGAGLRSDIANAKEYNTIERFPTSQSINVNFNIHNPFGFAQTDIKPFPWLKLTGGFRYDEFFFDVHSFIAPARYVAPDTGAFEPKGGITITPLAGLDVFANIGQGIRSPSAVFDLPLNPSIDLTTVTSEEAGIQYNSRDGQRHFLGSVYTTNLTNEIQENPPPEPPTNLGPSRREGFDIEGGYRLLETDTGITCSLLANYSALQARLVGNQHGMGSDVPNTPKWLAKYGGELRWPIFGPRSSQVIFIYANQQFVGESELDTAAHQRAGSYSRFNLDAWYTDANWLGTSAYFEATAYPFGRFNETAVEFNSTTVGISPKSPVTVQAGIHLPLNFLPNRF
ncbi:MAG: TonB-dependent receptor plug domain-containing protein [Acidobacteriaceae bacterium]|nr:TonB-dependent receptor plug domain-containing protein [Acidobacteriaceae bacterium]